VPGVEIDLPGALAEVGRERRVVDEVPRRRERPRVRQGVPLDEPHAWVVLPAPHQLGVPAQPVEDPDVLEVEQVVGFEELPEERLRMAVHAPPTEGLVEDDMVADGERPHGLPPLPQHGESDAAGEPADLVLQSRDVSHGSSVLPSGTPIECASAL
jgi:hypothetical protein